MEDFVFESEPIGLGETGEIAMIYMEDFQLRATRHVKLTTHSVFQQWLIKRRFV